ncbi:MAG: preprotein translocase subunit SecY [Lachnospiraceae bacterium]|nr:preprotein translocase subunit SecY [Lachnospiraceae bacterium]
MLTMFINAFKVKDIRRKLLFTFICLIVIRLGCMVPVPGYTADATNWIKQMAENLGFLGALTGGSLEKMSIFALNVSPYITSSIIMQLLTIAIPALAELQKDGETGRKKIAEYSRYLTVLLAMIEGGAIAIGFSRAGRLVDTSIWTIIIVTIAFTAGSAFLMWLGENITEHGVGNGISIILLINIVSSMPQAFKSMFQTVVGNASNNVTASLKVIVCVLVIAATLILVVLLQDAERKIAVQYSRKMQGRRMVGGNSSAIPLKVNTAGVIPVIFAMSIYQFPTIISSLCGVTESTSKGLWPKILYAFNQNHWFKFGSLKEFAYTIGAVFYVVMILFFAYFYTSITFNPIEVSNNMKKDGGFIPGIRPGKPTTDYLVGVLNHIVFIGAVGLAIVSLIPMIFGGVFGVSLGFTGTGLIIVVGVILETMKQIESQLLVRHYKGFLND